MYGVTGGDLDIQARARVFADELIPFEVRAELDGLPDDIASAEEARIWEGTSEIQRVIIARQLTRRGPSALA